MTSSHPGQRSWMAAIKATPFHGAAAESSLVNSWTQWGDYTVADVYSCVEEEYDAIRHHGGICDLSPSIKYRIRGQDAAAFVDRLLTRDTRTLDVDQSLFSPFCNDDGYVIDFAVVHRLDQSEYALLTTYRHMPWFHDNSAGYENVTIDDVTDEIAIMSLHGVVSCGALLLAGIKDIETLKPNQAVNVRFKKIDMRVARNRSLGELSYQLWLKPNDAVPVWQRVHRAAKQLDVRPVGLTARDICRIEAGYVTPGKDFVSAAAARFPRHACTPFDLGLDHCVDLDKDHFNGRRALIESRERGLRTQLVGLSVDGVIPVTGARVFAGDQLVGSVTSSAWSPLLQHVIALAGVEPNHGNIGHGLEIEMVEYDDLQPKLSRRGANIVARPFYVSPARNALIKGGSG